MPPTLREYGRHDWARLRPLTQRYKSLRHDAINAIYVRRMGRAEPVRALAGRLRGRALVCSIAFNSEWAIDIQSRLIGRYLVGAEYVVADNSNDPVAAARIAALCASRGVNYLRLPANPYGLGSESRSHGLAMNWVHRNLIRAAAAPLFGFVDHDIFPIAPVDPADYLRGQPVFGRLIARERGWYLWAGFCFFAAATPAGRQLDFRLDWFNGFDTGGGNWRRLYARLDRAGLRFPPLRLIPLENGEDGGPDSIELIGDWLHCGNASGWRKGAPSKRAAVEGMLQPHF